MGDGAVDDHIPGGDTRAIQRSIYNRQCARALEHLMGIVTGIVADDLLVDKEVQFLSTWLSAHPEATTDFPGSLIHRKVRDILVDGVITAAEREHLLDVLQHVSGVMFSDTGSADPDPLGLPINDAVTVTLPNAGICLTGQFLFGTRAACERLSLKAGATPLDSVTRKVDYLIIGTRVSPAWVGTSYGRKIQRAVELQEQGHPIEIISERRWIAAHPAP
jgi:NAD-dependent DNA ligase